MKVLAILCVLITYFIICGPIDSSSFAELSNSNTSFSLDTISQEDANKLLIEYNPKLKYIYQGDENSFDALKSKNLTGYVFLPDIETDIGYFVDKETSDIYFFHPSGYLELAKKNSI